MKAGRPLTPRERSILEFPERGCRWAIVLKASLPGADIDCLVARVPPGANVRLARGGWVVGPPPEVRSGSLSELIDSPFDLEHEPPLRLWTSGTDIALIGHHAALDGRALVDVLASMSGARPDPQERRTPRAGTASTPGMLTRLRRPAAALAPKLSRAEHLASREFRLSGPNVSARLAEAAASATWDRIGPRRIGISFGVGGEPGIGNHATYRRIDVEPGQNVSRLSAAALADEADPAPILRRIPFLRLMAPLARRMSDTFLVSNLGRVDIPGVERLEFYPVARGRSAVAFGAVGLKGGPSTLTIRSLYLSKDDAESLLDDVVRRLAP